MTIECVTNGDLDAVRDRIAAEGRDPFFALWDAKALGNTEGALAILNALATELETGGIRDSSPLAADLTYATWLRERRDDILRAAERRTAVALPQGHDT